MALEHKIIIPYDAKEEFTTAIKSKLDELELSYKLKTKNEYTNLFYEKWYSICNPLSYYKRPG